MNFAVHQAGLCSSHFRRILTVTGAIASAEHKDAGNAVRRRRSLKMVDRELSKGNYKTAVSLVKQLNGKPGGLRGFGAAKQVSHRLDDLKLHESLQSLVDSILDLMEKCRQFAMLDEVSVKALEKSMPDEGNGSHCDEDHFLYTQHEAGHFLVGYLLGVLPRGYEIPSKEALRQDRFAAGRVEFVGFEFLREVRTTEIVEKKFSKGKTLNRFSCVIVAGLIAEYLVFGYSEGLHSDVEQLDEVLKWLGFSESEAYSQMKWAVLNTVLILSRHHEARLRLAKAMALGKPVGYCIDTIENVIKEVI
ncbi:uncharacterized protein LOC117930220 isoform X2 [Vitis riparia]|uniref:uncharacterized protein LOC117930220 isoform X2 n=1 Tax=Vitis riparia TaxID=96939 RepID=UPI00155B044D|nr:uncharacterized protein LOC117930220 isoform X2 [Vitis riparia]